MAKVILEIGYDRTNLEDLRPEMRCARDQMKMRTQIDPTLKKRLHLLTTKQATTQELFTPDCIIHQEV